MTDAELERRLRTGLNTPAAGAVDVDRAWREFQHRTLPRGRQRRRRRTVVSLVTAAAVLAAAGLLAAVAPGRPGGSHPAPAASLGSSPTPHPFRTFPHAVVARIPLPGMAADNSSGASATAVVGPADGVTVVGDRTAVWAITAAGLFRIDVATSKVTLRVPLTSREGAGIAAGGGALWLTTGSGPARGQLVRMDFATGHVTATLHLARTGLCDWLGYGYGHLWAGCDAGRGGAEFLRINTATGTADARLGPVRGLDPFSSASVTPQGVWYSTGSDLGGFVRRDGHWRSVGLSNLSWVYGLNLGVPFSAFGTLWVMTPVGSISKIDPATGRVNRVFTYLDFDPVHGPSFLAGPVAGNGSLWLIGPNAEVARVSAATGHALGWLPALGSCSPMLRCGDIYATPGAVWVRAGSALVHIDPARMPG